MRNHFLYTTLASRTGAFARVDTRFVKGTSHAIRHRKILQY